jgi:tRNA nucleotidyltransferase/poly(A) polymerase
MAIPRQQGNYEIPAAAFSYFDTSSGSYKTLQIPAYLLHIDKGDGNAAAIIGGNIVNKEEIKQLGNDIRYINTTNFKLRKEEVPLVKTVTAWFMYVIPLFVALLLFFIFRKKAKENSDLRLVRNKRANKVAVKRLKDAKNLLNAGKKDAFYEETLKSIWNYLSDKLNILSAELTKEKVGETLAAKGVITETIEQLNNTLNTCEFARYAPNTGQHEMGNLYEKAIDLIGKIEDAMNR